MTDASFEVTGYDIVELLGFGATGEVWLARELATGDLVALKRVRTAAAGGLAARDRIRREAAVLSAIDHPHLVRLRHVLSCPDDLVLVLDHAAGGSLEALLAARGVLSPGEVVTLGAPLAQALAAVHARSVLHGDVCPANVLWTATGRPVLADLGVARVLGENVEEIATTRDWADPALGGGAMPEPASDVFALAAVCFTALAGLPPLDGGIRRDLASLASSAPVELVDAIESGLRPDPADRPSAAEFAAILYAAAPAKPVTLVRRDGLVVVEVDGDDDVRSAARTVSTPLARPPVAPVPLERSHLRRLQARRARLSGRNGGGTGASAARPGRSSDDRCPQPAAARVSGVRRDAAGGASSPAAGRRRAGSAGAARRGEDPVGDTRRPAHARPPWRVVGTVAAVVAALTGAALTGVVWAGAGDAADGAALGAARGGMAAPAGGQLAAGGRASAPRTPAAEPADWSQVLTDLYAVREEAFERADPTLLAQVYAPDSPDLAYTRGNVERLAEAGATAHDVSLDVVSAVPVDGPARGDASSITLRVVDVLGPATIMAPDGSVSSELAGRGEVAAEVDLVRTDGGWRVVRTRPGS